MQSSFSRTKMSLALASALCLAAVPMLLSGCKRASAGTTIPTASPQAVELRAPAVGPDPAALQEPLHGHPQPLRLGEPLPHRAAEHGHAACDPGRRQPQPVGRGRNAASGLRAPPGPHRARQRPARCPRRRSRELLALWPRGCHRRGARHARPRPVPRSAATSKPPSRPSATWAWWSTSGPNPACADICLAVVSVGTRLCVYNSIPANAARYRISPSTRSRADASTKVDPHLRTRLEG